jgi:3,4-dihydroxy 2-butanone 4-phosphate synthase/GTP cyclohydrolase II
LLTNNPAKLAGVQGYGIDVVERRGISIDPTEHNLRYLRTKRDRMGHHLPGSGLGGVLIEENGAG